MTPSTAALAHSPLLADTILQREIDLEHRAVREGVQRYYELAQEAIRRGDGASLKPAERLVVHWFAPLCKSIKTDRARIIAGDNRDLPSHDFSAPAMMLVEADRLAALTLRCVVSLLMREPGGLPFVHVAYSVGRDVFAEAHMDILRAQDRARSDDEPSEVEALAYKMRRLNARGINRWAAKKIKTPIFQRKVATMVGARLLWHVIGVCTLAAPGEPFRKSFHKYPHKLPDQPAKHKGKAWFRMDEEAYDIIARGHELRSAMRPRYLPMLVEPYPWVAPSRGKDGEVRPGSHGGYIHIRTPLISRPAPEQTEALKRADMTRFYDGLSAVQRTPMRINRRLFAVVERVWEEGGGTLGIPRREPIPMPPEVQGADEAAVAAAKAERVRIYRENIGEDGERVGFLSTLDATRLFEKEPRFWLPHQIDFRGRCFPIPRAINHHDRDVRRAMLDFADAVPADDKESQYWLRVHAANCWGNGVDKKPYRERVQWVEGHARQIQEAADDPLDSGWWRGAEDPWQFLAACFALHDPEAAAHLPTKWDGTCNGLQHYALLGRDEIGAELVNLVNAERPSDPYGNVAETLRGLLTARAQDGDEQAAALLPLVGRSLVKQYVMTTPYGVTLAGAQNQLAAQLKETGLEGKALYKASRYLVLAVRDAVANACRGASTVRDWLDACAAVVTKAGRPMAWTSPCGFPVVQAYRNYGLKKVRTAMGDLGIIDLDSKYPISAGKQRDAFSANAIHGIDAAHMYAIGIEARDGGMAFAHVNDQFWSHAACRVRMMGVYLDTMVRLHTEYTTRTLHADLSAQHPDLVLPEPPPPGDFDIERVREATYAFS